jgi:RHS repeat-associated protein
VDSVLEPCAVAGKAGAFGGLQAKVARVIVWDPDRWQVIEPEQMGQDLGVDLVGFDLCLCDGAGLQRVANSDGVDEGTEDSDHSPRVKSGLHCDLVKGRQVALREVCDALASGGEAMAKGDLAGIVEDDSFDIFLVQIETSEWHKMKSPVMTSQRAAASLKVSCDHRTGSGQNGNYLFELEAQPGGPMGRPDTTAGSKPISPVGRPRSVRPRSPGWDVDALEHLVPNPVGCSLAQFVAGLQDDHARYDGFGNRLSQTVTQGTGPSSVTLVNGNTNRISSAGYAYDPNGNMTQMPKGSGSMTLDYDLSNRVSGVSHPDGAEQYRYAPDNRRVWRSAGRTACYASRGNDQEGYWGGYGEGATEQVILYSPGGQKMGAYCLSFSPNLQYFAVTASEENVFYGGRLVGKRLVSVTNSNNGLVSDFTADRLQSKGNGSNYYPYGESKNSTAGDDREGFATYTRDENSGLDYADQRWYASGVGRFTSPDPFEPSANRRDPASWNRYTYVRNNPSNRTDPKGLFDLDPSDPTNCFFNPSACWNPWPGVIVFPGGGETSWVELDNGTVLYAQYGDSVAWPTVNWSGLMAFAATQAIPFPGAGTLNEPIPWIKFVEWVTAIGRRFPALIALELSVSRMGDEHLPPDPSKCPGKDAFNKPDKAPFSGWTWKGPDSPGGSRGAWVSPDGSQSLHPDLNHPPPVKPHWDYRDPLGTFWRCYEDGRIELRDK